MEVNLWIYQQWKICGVTFEAINGKICRRKNRLVPNYAGERVTFMGSGITVEAISEKTVEVKK